MAQYIGWAREGSALVYRERPGVALYWIALKDLRDEAERAGWCDHLAATRPWFREADFLAALADALAAVPAQPLQPVAAAPAALES